MEHNSSIIEKIEGINVDNVFIYVSDALRWDYLPDQVSDQGIAIKSISASTHSPSSFASILSGQHLPNHGVESFRHQLSPSTSTLLDIPEYHSLFLNSIFEFSERKHSTSTDPIYSVLNIDAPNVDHPFEDLQEPFCVVERGPGGHAPYGEFDGTATEYFREKSTKDIKTIRDDYARSVEKDAELFLSRVERLQEMGLSDDTLVIFTSDHGELLGEGGELGHSSPMRSELVYVPTVFIHSNLPATRVDDVTLHHVDLLSTIIDVLDIEPEFSMPSDGKSLVEGLPKSPRPSFYKNTFLPDWLPSVSGALEYEGVWDTSGGHVSVKSPKHDRLLVLGGKSLRSSRRKFIMRNFRRAVNAYSKSGLVSYEDPKFPSHEAESLLKDAVNTEVDERKITLSDDAEQHLRDLGYK
ncbi:sulfatase-like hydrolase/transferase [Halosolutus halophilus]|uniref:sulfatase-like hydrolase/transferase n=1 Tax=Halosolutus halophilus TaxID=1552990 RepID=UPI002234F0D5|nr:sulfatase-like hydrolase/transferase [Halosolutus halophilus]